MHLTIFYLLFILNFPNYSLTSDIFEREQNKIDKNLKLLRNDFNKLVDNVEDFASNFLKEIEDIGKVIPQDILSAPLDQDYNWDKDDSNFIKKVTEPSVKSTLTTTIESKFPVEKPNKKKQQTIKDYVTHNGILYVPRSRAKRSDDLYPSYSQNDGLKIKSSQFDDDRRQSANLVSSQNKLTQVEDLTATTENCKTKLDENVLLEQQKLQELKNEVEQLNKLISLLKRQQSLLKNNEGKADNFEISSLFQNNDQQGDTKSHIETKTSKVELSKESTYLEEVSKLRLNLHKNEEILNKTKEILFIERRKGEEIELELKRQNSELKFLKAMMENLYDKSNSVTENRGIINSVNKKKGLKDNDLKDLDFDDIVGLAHTPRPLPTIKREGLRESTSSESHDSNMRRLLSVLKSKKYVQEENSKRVMAANAFDNDQILKDNGTLDFKTRSSDKTEDLVTKLKLLDLISNKEAKTEESNKDEHFAKVLKLLQEPEKKSDESVLVEDLIKLVKQKQEVPKANHQEDLMKLLQSLNTPKPQSKAEDNNIEDELRQLQFAINNLRPKDHSNGLNQFDFESIRRGKDNPTDFQSLLSQIISQNNGVPNSISSQSSENIPSNIGPSTIAAPQLLSQYMTSHNPQMSSSTQTGLAQLQNVFKLYESSLKYPKPNPVDYGAGSNSQRAFPYGVSPLYESYKYGDYGPNLNTYGSNQKVNYAETIYSPSYDSLKQNSGFANFINPSTSPVMMNNYQPIELNKYIDSIPYSASYSSKPIGSTMPYRIQYEAPSYYAYQQYPITKNFEKYGINSASNQASIASPAFAGIDPYYGNSNSNNYGGSIAQGSSGSKIQPMRPFQYGTNSGGIYQDTNYGSRSYSGSALDQPYSNIQDTTQYRNSMINDLNLQIQRLERIITGLNKADGYYQSPEDRVAVAGLEEKILSLKSIIQSLNQPSYVPTQPSSYKQQPINNNPQTNFQAPTNEYKPIEPPYQPNKVEYVNPIYSQQSSNIYASTISPHIAPSSASPPAQFPYQPSNPSQSPNNQNYNLLSSNQSNQPSLPSYQSKPQENLQQNPVAYQPPATQGGEVSTSYQPKQSTANDRVDKIRRRTFEMAKTDIRNKRQVQDADLRNKVYFNRDQMRTNDNENGYERNDALLQIANTFKKYLEENIPEPNIGTPTSSEMNQQMRTNGLNDLQKKLESLKLQLESQKPLPRFLPVPKSYLNYESPQPVDNSKLFSKTVSLTNKKQDIFTHIVVQIVQKLLNALPEVLNVIFGNIFTSVGGVSGDYSPLQSILKNLGSFGYFPLIAVKILDSLGPLFTHLNKSQFFKQFLLPGISFLLIGGVVLFLIFFYQQNNSSYGYLEYQQSNSNYPRYEELRYYKPSDVSSYANTRNAQYFSDIRPSFNKIDNYYNERMQIPGYTAKSFIGDPPIPYTRGYLN